MVPSLAGSLGHNFLHISLLELSDPYMKNKNWVLPIVIEKSFEQQIYFCLLKMRSIFFKEGK